MKTMIGKIIILTIALLTVFACRNPFEPSDLNKPATGTGYFSFAISETDIGRTIVPEALQDSFLIYTIEFLDVSSGTDSTIIVDRSNTNLSDPVLLKAGIWDLHIWAYMDTEKTKLAAQGILTAIEIISGATTTRNVTLTAAVITSDGEGTFSWNINYPSNVYEASMTIIPFNEPLGTPLKTLYFTGGTPLTGRDDCLTLNVGYYRVIFNLYTTNEKNAVLKQILHVYYNMESAFEYSFSESNFTDIIMVTSDADNGPGSLRQAITNSSDGSTIVIDNLVETIALKSRLTISKSLIINGNGVVLMREASWTTESTSSQLMYIDSSGVVTIKRFYFKDGRATDYGAAIRNEGSMTLESCIFSGNKTSATNAYGGAIFNSSTTCVMGCTFFRNSTGSYGGGAIYSTGSSSMLTLAGNLFYENTATGSSYPVVLSQIVTSLGFNTVDKELGTEPAQSGWTAAITDKKINFMPISPISFKLLSGSETANVITTLPDYYPVEDYYGKSIISNAASGAVQATINRNGYVIDLTANNSDRGSIDIVPAPDADGMAFGTVTVTASPVTGYEFGYWLKDGIKSDNTNPLELTLTDHTRLKAVFIKIIIVDNFTDESGSAIIAGTLRHALTNAENDDIIRLGGITPGQTSIALTSRLPNISRNITIEGNGVTVTRDAAWTIESASSQLMYINSSGIVAIDRIHFKDGRATGYGAAIRNEGYLALESCIFSGNKTDVVSASNYYGGAVCNGGTMYVKGCTFSRNSSKYYGGAIYNSGILTIEGNLFYENTAPVIYSNYENWNNEPSITSDGYNVVDVPMGYESTQSGWTASITDKTINGLPISFLSFRLLSGSGAANIITALPDEYPSVDFYGDLIANGAAAGAVQATANSSGYVLELMINNSNRGDVNTSPEPDDEGLFFNTVTLTATPSTGYEFGFWLKDGIKNGSSNPLNLTLTAHTRIQAVFIKIFVVDNFTDASGSVTIPGTLRHALTNVENDDIIRLNGVTPGQTSIALTSRLPNITRSITIEGNGVTIKRDTSWNTETDSSQLMYVDSSGLLIIKRVCLKEGRTTGYGAAIRNQGNLTLESCIFSNNCSYGQKIGNGYYESYGGAIYSSGTMTVKGCTFLVNSSEPYGYGGAICNIGILMLEGNLFYGNAAYYCSVIYNSINSTTTSRGYNVVDVPMGYESTQSGWTASVTDRIISSPPISPVSFRPLSGSGTANIIAVFPDEYPSVDFYGNSIANGAAAGAVQTTANSSGYVLELKINNRNRGDVIISPEPDDEGLYINTVTLTANPAIGYGWGYWLVDDNNVGDTNPLVLTLTDHIKVQAVFVIIVDNFTDASDSATTKGTLRYALIDADDGDIIRLSGVTPGQTTIALTSGLSVGSVIIEGNGVTITPDDTWTSDYADRLMYINSRETHISRIHFKNGWASSGAIYHYYGNLLLESCIFSSNQDSSSGMAIYIYRGSMDIKGCTFYGYSCPRGSDGGGAIYVESYSYTMYQGELTFEGNLFYGNTHKYFPVMFIKNSYWSVASKGYNVVDVPLGKGYSQSGWAGVATDKSIDTPMVSGNSFKLLTGSGAANIINTLPEGYPTVDFYGNPITNGAAAGAVQSQTSGSGYYIDLAINNNAGGSVAPLSFGDEDGLVSDAITLTAVPVTGYEFRCWLIDGTQNSTANTLNLNLTAHSKVKAIFTKIIMVNNFTDASDSATTPGTLRHAFTNSENDDITIRLIGVTTGQTIALTYTLGESYYDCPDHVTIEGNGITITRDTNSTNFTSELLHSVIEDIYITGVHFKDGRSYDYAGAIYNVGNLTLESCIFSGNQNISNNFFAYGGAIQNYGNMNVKGCTFYNNRVASMLEQYGYAGGGVIFHYGPGTLTLEGNLFFGNTVIASYSAISPVVYRNTGSNVGPVISKGYNVVDVPVGVGDTQSGWIAAIGDTTFSALSISGVPFDINTFVSVPGLGSVIPTSPVNFSMYDFYGNTRTFPGAPGAVK